MYFKDFDKWNEVKKRVHHEERKVNIRSGEIRWVSFGINVGSEIDGKGISFTRPALILHVVGSHLALIVPMSTKVKDVAGYMPFTWKNTTIVLCLHQIRIISSKRVLSRKGRISSNKLEAIKKDISKFFSF